MGYLQNYLFWNYELKQERVAAAATVMPVLKEDHLKMKDWLLKAAH